jgi:hypothetical protein
MYGDYSVDSCVEYYQERGLAYVNGFPATPELIGQVCASNKSTALWVGITNLIFGVLLVGLSIALKMRVDKMLKAQRERAAHSATDTEMTTSHV